MIIIYGHYTGQYVFDVFTLSSSMAQANTDASKGVSALQGSAVECAAGCFEARPAPEGNREGEGGEVNRPSACAPIKPQTWYANDLRAIMQD
jgi:hypothetical protein